MQSKHATAAVLFGLLLVLFVGLPFSSKAADIPISGTISSATTWAANVYILDGAVTLNSGVLLTINQGAIIKFKTTSTQLIVNGTLDARGTSTTSIYFTSYYDDSVGGDTDGGGPSSGSGGEWRNILIGSAASSTMAYAVIRYGGNSGGGSTNIYNNGGNLTVEYAEIATGTTYGIKQETGTSTITGSTFHHQSYGVYMADGSANISSNTFRDHWIYGLKVESSDGTLTLTLTNNTFSDNSTGAAYINFGGTFTHSGNTASGPRAGYVMSGSIGNATWTADDLPYIIPPSLTISEGTTLTINPGVVVKFDGTSSQLIVNGTLDARGTSATSIYFTSYLDDSVGGDTNNDGASSGSSGNWRNIFIASTASSTIAYTVIRYGGNSGGGSTNIYNSGGNLTVEYAEIATGTTYGIRQETGTSTITGSTFHHQSYGVYMTGGNANISSNTFRDHWVYGLKVESNDGSLTLTNNTFSDNSTAAAYINFGGTFTHSGNTASGARGGYVVSGSIGNATWTAGDLPYIITPSLTISGGTTLTVNPGVVVKFDGTSSYLLVSGGLNAEGTSGNKIYLTSIQDDDADGLDTNNDGASSGSAGNWRGITIDTNASSTITHAVIRNGGNSGGNQANIFNNGGWLTVSSTEVATGTTYGIRGDSGTTTIVESSIHHQSYGVYQASGSSTIFANDIYTNTYGVYFATGTINISENAFSSNSSYGLYNASGITIGAADNWWGHYTGPGPSGDGDDVNNVDASYWHYAHNVATQSSINGGRIRWDSSTSYSDEWDAAVDTWNDENLGNEISIFEATSTVDLTIEDIGYVEGFFIAWPGLYKPKSVSPTTTTDMIYFNTYDIDIREEYNSTSIRTITTHELGHALGLGHSYAGNVMFDSVSGQDYLGDQDKKDYHYWWVWLRWVLPAWILP